MNVRRRVYTGFLVAVALLIGCLTYRSRLLIAAKIWHWRNGHAVIVAEYQVYVPDGWFVTDARERSDATLLDTRVKRTPDQIANANIILILFVPHFPGNLEIWNSNSEQSFKQKGMSDVQEKILQTKDEAVSCLGGHVLNELMHLPSRAITMQCMSAGGLFLTFSGDEEGLQEFYNIISQIRRHV